MIFKTLKKLIKWDDKDASEHKRQLLLLSRLATSHLYLMMLLTSR